MCWCVNVSPHVLRGIRVDISSLSFHLRRRLPPFARQQDLREDLDASPAFIGSSRFSRFRSASRISQHGFEHEELSFLWYHVRFSHKRLLLLDVGYWTLFGSILDSSDIAELHEATVPYIYIPKLRDSRTTLLLLTSVYAPHDLLFIYIPLHAFGS